MTGTGKTSRSMTPLRYTKGYVAASSKHPWPQRRFPHLSKRNPWLEYRSRVCSCVRYRFAPPSCLPSLPPNLAPNFHVRETCLHGSHGLRVDPLSLKRSVPNVKKPPVSLSQKIRYAANACPREPVKLYGRAINHVVLPVAPYRVCHRPGLAIEPGLAVGKQNGPLLLVRVV